MPNRFKARWVIDGYATVRWSWMRDGVIYTRHRRGSVVSSETYKAEPI